MYKSIINRATTKFYQTRNDSQLIDYLQAANGIIASVVSVGGSLAIISILNNSTKARMDDAIKASDNRITEAIAAAKEFRKDADKAVEESRKASDQRFEESRKAADKAVEESRKAADKAAEESRKAADHQLVSSSDY